MSHFLVFPFLVISKKLNPLEHSRYLLMNHNGADRTFVPVVTILQKAFRPLGVRRQLSTYTNMCIYILIRDLYSPQPLQKIESHRKYPYQIPAELPPHPNQPPKKLVFQRCIKWQKFWKMGEKMGKKSIFHWDFCM